MKNKNKISEYGRGFNDASKVFLILVLLVGFFVGLAFLLNKVDEPKFKITEEKCEIINKTNGCLNANLMDGSHLQVCYHENNSVSIKNCEEVEVDEIYYEYGHYEYKYFEVCPTDGRACGGGGYYINNISKEDLTIDWLDENCELMKDYGNEEVVTEGSDFHWNKKYSCGNYQVEVLK